MNKQIYTIEKDHLAIGLTKPTIFMGIPMKLFFFNILLGTLICINAHTFWGVPLSLAFYFLIFKFSMKDPMFLEVWLQSIIKTPPIINSFFWGNINSYAPW